MNAIESFLSLMQEETLHIEDTIRGDLQELATDQDPLLTEVLQYALLNGGKRVRPILVLLAARFCGGSDKDLLRLAIAFEYLHVASLVHDDVIDRAETRRGKATVAHKFGLVPAILSGDYLLARSMTLVGELGGSEGLQVFCHAIQGMVDGEFVQLRNNQQYDMTPEKYYEAVKGKTALLISAACEVGCIYAGGTKAQREAFASYGANIGTAFQIVDDLLDYLGEQGKIGKTPGNDLVEGKVTLPLILALHKADSADKQRLLETLADEQERAKGLELVIELVTQNDGFTASKHKAQELIELAIDTLTRIDCQDTQALEALTGLAQYIVERKK